MMDKIQKILGIKFKSVEDASVIRKFSVFFALMSFFPFVVLAVIFYLFVSKGEIGIRPQVFSWTVFVAGIFTLIGFLSMRQTFINLMKVAKSTKDILKGDFSKRIDIQTDQDNEIIQLARAFNEIVQQLEHNIKQLEKSKRTVQEILLKIAGGLSSIENIDAFLDLILSTTVEALDGNVGMLLVTDMTGKDLLVKCNYGLDSTYPKDKMISAEDEVVGWVVKQKRPLLIPRLHKIPAVLNGEKTFEPPLICAPLIFQNRILGVISVSGKKQESDFEEDELVILSNIASQVALAMEHARLNADNEKTYFETISALALAVEARDIYSRGHSDRVGGYVLKIAKQLNLDEGETKAIQEAAQLHDVGKIGIGDDILKNTDMFDQAEREIMEQHPVIGEGIIVPLHGFLHLRDAIRHHHEWLNGEGYPDHLKGDEISLAAKILSVADCFDAITTDRPYQKGKTFQEAKEVLLQYAEIRYDKKVVDALISALNL